MTRFENLSIPQLIEEAVRGEKAKLSVDGALVTLTGKFTGRAAKDKYIVDDEQTRSLVEWGPVNQAMTRENFTKLRSLVVDYLSDRNTFSEELQVGSDPEFSFPLVVQCEFAHQAIFAKTMFRQRTQTTSNEKPFRVYAAPSVVANPKDHGTVSETFIAMDLSNREIVIGGTHYCGEIKKSVFTLMNYLLPQRGVLTMHAAANLDNDGKSAVFFGLSGTGKTSLSADSKRRLIGDDEHGWSENGIFNLEGGCYAKAIRLSRKAEPEIWDACHSFGTLLENVLMDETSRTIDFDSQSITENTRAAYALSCIPNYEPSGCGGHPSAVIMLACDAFGVLPPVSKLTHEQAMYYFLSGYTAKVAGTEVGITEPKSTFSACFGEPFMALSPIAYAKLLGERLRKFSVPCYLINTGWWKGPYGVGERMPISLSRALVNAAVSGELAKAECERHPLFGFLVPKQLSGIPSSTLRIEESWENRQAYDDQAKKLARMFVENFKNRFFGKPDFELASAGPQI